MKLLKDQPPCKSEGLLNALRYTTKHLNEENTPKNIKNLLAAWLPKQRGCCIRSWDYRPHFFAQTSRMVVSNDRLCNFARRPKDRSLARKAWPQALPLRTHPARWTTRVPSETRQKLPENCRKILEVFEQQSVTHGDATLEFSKTINCIFLLFSCRLLKSLHVCEYYETIVLQYYRIVMNISSVFVKY